MKAVILAAGYGNRMRPLTDEAHKTLIEINGETILKRIIQSLKNNGVTDVVMVTGYRAQELQEYLDSQFSDVEFTYVHNERYRETNNIFSMALAFEKMTIDSDIILIESDLVIEESIITRLINSPYDNVALVDKFRTGMDGTVVALKNNVITDVIPPHRQSSSFDFSDKYKTLNMYKFSQEFCEASFKKLLLYYARSINDNCYYELILGMLIYMQQDTIHGEVVDEIWAEVDDPNDLEQVKYLFGEQKEKILVDNFGGFWNYDITDYCFIRNMYFPTNSIISEMKNSLPSLIHNYGSKQVKLNQKMAWFLLCNEKYVRALNGAAQVYPTLQLLYGDKKVLLPKPSFGEYERIFSDKVYYRDEIGIDTEDIDSSIEECECVVFVNPNNPTGSEVPSHYILSCAEKYPNKVFIVDESFIEFSTEQSIRENLETGKYNNIILLKSLSKSLGIPGVRLGYVYTTNQSVLQKIDSMIPIWNMNSLAEFTLEILLKHRNVLRQSLIQTIADREELTITLREIPWVDEVFKSGGNFLCFSLKDDAPDVQTIVDTMLNKHDIYLKNVSSKFSTGKQYIRIAVRLPKEHRILIDTLKEL